MGKLKDTKTYRGLDPLRNALAINPPLLFPDYMKAADFAAVKAALNTGMDETNAVFQHNDGVVYYGAMEHLRIKYGRDCGLRLIRAEGEPVNWLAFGFPPNSSLRPVVNRLILASHYSVFSVPSNSPHPSLSIKER